jgi:hypothetical protein
MITVTLVPDERSVMIGIPAGETISIGGCDMAKDQRMEALKSTAEEAVEETREQARGAMDSYFDFLHKTVSSCPSGGTELGEKLKGYAETNIAAARDYMHKLSQAKDFTDVVRIQTEFIQSQFNAFGEQTKSLGEAYSKAAADTVSKPFKTS